MARTPAQSIPSLTSGAGTLLQARTLPSSSRSPVFTTAAPGLPAAEYFRTSTHPEREPFENFVCVCVCVPRALSTSWAGPGSPGWAPEGVRNFTMHPGGGGGVNHHGNPTPLTRFYGRVTQRFSTQFSCPDRPQGAREPRGNPPQSAPSSSVTS